MADREFEDSEDTLSLCDLPTEQIDEVSISQIQNSNSIKCSDQQLFEFSGDSTSEISPIDNFLFCGKLIPYDEDELNEYQKRDYFCVRSSSLHKPRENQIAQTESDQSSRSLRFAISDSDAYSNRSLIKCESSAVQKVNITAITTMSAKWRWRMFMFGPVKFKPEMELSAIKKRQSRRSPAPIFPAYVDGDGKVVTGGGMVRPLRCRSHLVTLLAKSFGCIPTSVL